MTKPTETLVEFPRQSARDVLTEVLRTGARQLLATAIEAEVDEYVTARAKTVDAAGRRGVVRKRPPAQTGAANPARGRHRAAAAGSGPPAGRRTGDVPVGDLAAVPAEDTQLGGAVSVALSQGPQHRGLR